MAGIGYDSAEEAAYYEGMAAAEEAAYLEAQNSKNTTLYDLKEELMEVDHGIKKAEDLMFELMEKRKIIVSQIDSLKQF